MKTNLRILTSLVITIQLFTLNSCCKQMSCIPVDTHLKNTYLLKDFNTGSAYFNQSVAVFEFKQKTTSWKKPNECTSCLDPLVSNVDLSIQNTIPKTIRIEFIVNFNLNMASWNYQNVVTLQPLQTIELSQISNNPASIALGQFNIIANNITYP